ncbi:CDP-alcohol phosphatidyltransferase family protein [Aureimonas altamirensis]|uniref:CDP-alcohol phosphatidyltransferase family protein n=1 Tax=Aureimonas altamirensis TaxID=370622 RepID=UPI00203684D7|nr:CDP-alcohol phosphatidyltransferase family protein [Aureimonas altamirensis]MCM2504358.1 CDP-alcohol phosphatidyltransferase family protein [Aureimonas altamirensis]
MEDATRHGCTEIAYRQAAARAVLIRFLSASLPLLALALLLAHVLAPGRPGIVTLIVIVLHGAATGVAGYGLWSAYPYDRLGGGNLVTQLRAAMAVSLAACLAHPVADDARWIVVAVATVSLLLDGIDGWLARRDGLVSRFGARYDMEVDSFLALMLCLVAWRSAGSGAEVLLLGLPRYGFLLAAAFLPFLRGALPQSFRRKACCVLQIAALILLVAPWPAGLVVDGLALLAGGCLYASFAVDIAHLRRRRA